MTATNHDNDNHKNDSHKQSVVKVVDRNFPVNNSQVFLFILTSRVGFCDLQDLLIVIDELSVKSCHLVSY